MGVSIDLNVLLRRVASLEIALAELVERLPLQDTLESWRLDARFPIAIANLYDPEFWDNRVKRWVGPEPSFGVRLPFEGGRLYLVEIQVVDFIIDENHRAFTLYVDGLPLPWMSSTGLLFRAKFVAPRSGLLPLQFCCPAAVSPSRLNPDSTDTRVLAFSLEWVHVRRLAADPVSA